MRYTTMMRKPKKPNNLLRQARQKRGWSQRRVAEAIGAYEDRVSRWEAGTTPGKYFQERLCNLFGLDAIQLGFIDLPDIKQQAPTLPKRSVTTSLDSADSMPLVERFL